MIVRRSYWLRASTAALAATVLASCLPIAGCRGEDERGTIEDLFVCRHRYNIDEDDGKVRVVGKKRDVGIYELMGQAGQVDEERMQYAQMFAEAVRMFQEGSFVNAVKMFEQCLKQKPDDKGAQLYLNTAQRYVAEAPFDDFTGGIELVEK